MFGDLERVDCLGLYIDDSKYSIDVRKALFDVIKGWNFFFVGHIDEMLTTHNATKGRCLQCGAICAVLKEFRNDYCLHMDPSSENMFWIWERVVVFENASCECILSYNVTAIANIFRTFINEFNASIYE